MKKHFAAMVVAIATAVTAAPACADQKPQQAAGKTSSKGKVAQSVDRQYGQTAGREASVYVHKPAYDVYVRGQYVGSDPDPHVRRQLRREWCEDSVDGCGFRSRD